MNKLKKYFSFFVFLLYFSLLLIAQDQLVESILNNVVDNFNRIKSVKCDLLIEINTEDNFLYLKGKYLADKEGRFKIEMRPTGDLILIISKGKQQVFYIKRMNKAFIYEKEDSSLTTNNVFETPSLATNKIVKDIFDTKLKKTIKQGWTETIVLEAIPKITNEFISKIEFYFSKELKLISKYVAYDLHGNVSQIVQFKDYQAFENSIWFPLEIYQETFEREKPIRVKIRYTNLEFNIPIEESNYNYDIPKDAKIEKINPEKILELNGSNNSIK